MAKSVFIFSCKPESADLCLNELKRSGLGLRFQHWLDPGVGLLQSKDSFAEVAAALAQAPPIFLLHLFPWEMSVPWGESRIAIPAERNSGESSLREALEQIASRMKQGQSFGVQLGRSPGVKMTEDPRKEIREFLSGRGFPLQQRHPDQVVTIYHTEARLCMGLSRAEQNISSWFGGKVAYAVREDTVSRSEFKLLEAIDHFGLQLPPQGLALDLGAAPGGWSKVALERGMRVRAVDPGEMAPALQKNPLLQHYRGTAQQFLRENRERFALLLNDMRLDVAESVAISVDAAAHLDAGALVIMTFKLPEKQKTAIIAAGCAALREAYTVLHRKQLYHNRSEITVIARKE